MFLYRLLLIFHAGAVAALLILFLLWSGTSPDLSFWAAIGFLLLLCSWAAIGAGIEYRGRGELRTANISLALLAIPVAIAIIVAVVFFWMLSQIEML